MARRDPKININEGEPNKGSLRTLKSEKAQKYIGYSL